MDDDFDTRLRAAALDFVCSRAERFGMVEYRELVDFQFEGRSVPLVNRPRGIRRPKGTLGALTILTTFRRNREDQPYQDIQGPDGLYRYQWRGDDPNSWDNIALRNTQKLGLPLIWFQGIDKGVYAVHAPVWLMSEEPEQHQFVVALDDMQRQLVAPGTELYGDTRRYVERLTRLRLHQPVFRAQVLRAYRQQCAVCRLRVSGLLDAAHIIADSRPHGLPVIPNGISLCKIHHAAYDGNILGIRPGTHAVEIREDILREVDGPMLRHGLQEMRGQVLELPTRQVERPDPDRLEERYEEFRAAG